MNKTTTKIISIIGEILLFALILASPSIYAAVPLELNYQGFLGDTAGDPVPDGNYLMSFAIYDAPTGGAELWSESQTVTVTDGIYSVILGNALNPIDPLIMDGNLYLGVTVESDPEMVPRHKLTSAAFSIRAAEADTADTLDGMDSTEFAYAAHTHSGNDITSGTVDEAYIDPNIARDSEIIWSNLSGIPSDIADGDDTGITTETDPTVITSVKDGVSWGELSGIPAGFADNVDNDSGGDITSVTAGTGLSGGGTSGSVTLNVDIPLSLTGSASQGVINASNSNGSGYGLYGYASNSGTVTNYGGYFQAEGSSGRGVYGVALGSSGRGVQGSGMAYNFYAIGPGTDYGPFTGAHEVKFVQGFPEDIRPGMIVSVCGRVEARVKDDGEISLSSTLPTVTVTQKAMDKAVFGVLVSESPLPEDHWYEAREGERFGVVNALGEGRVWVTDINGEIEAGDYITTSMIPGYGQLQDDDLLHSYTLGKAIEIVDWDNVTEVVEIDGKTYRASLIAVVYTSG